MMTNFLVQHNLPLTTSDHLSPLFKEIIPDQNAKKYFSHQTKTGAIINEGFAPHDHTYFVKHCQTHPYIPLEQMSLMKKVYRK